MDLKYIGYHAESSLPFKRGQEVTIKKGTKIHCMKRGDVIAKKTFKITIHHMMNGISYPKFTITDCDLRALNMTFQQIEAYPGNMIPGKNPSVCWPGTGGYWQEVDINDV